MISRSLVAFLLLALATGGAAAYEYLIGANAYWMPASVVFNEQASVDAALDGLQRVGGRLLRTWAFNQNLPSAPGVYSETELRALDYVVASAQRRGIRAILALGNFWAPYRGPEDWVSWAKANNTVANGTAASTGGWTGDVVDFYKQPAVRQLYKAHLAFMLGRANSVTGRQYASDPSIYGFGVINEPRCPGCDAAALAAHTSWLDEMTAFVKGLVKSGALVLAGTEGFFTPEASGHLLAQNPGAGAGCEGEDVLKISRLGAVDAMTTHNYWRHMEQMASLGWRRPDFEVYANWLDKELELYRGLADQLGKPWIIEEFGLTGRFFDQQQRKAVFAIVLSHLVRSKQQGGKLVAALWWNLAQPGHPDYGGYDVDARHALSGATIGLPNLGAAGVGAKNATSSPSPAPAKGGRRPGGSPAPPARSPAPSPAPASGRRLLRAPEGAAASSGGSGGGRRLSQLVVVPGTDELDSYRRASARAACANAAAYNWAFELPGQRIDTAGLLARVAGVDIVDIIAEAARLLA